MQEHECRIYCDAVMLRGKIYNYMNTLKVKIKLKIIIINTRFKNKNKVRNYWKTRTMRFRKGNSQKISGNTYLIFGHWNNTHKKLHYITNYYNSQTSQKTDKIFKSMLIFEMTVNMLLIFAILNVSLLGLGSMSILVRFIRMYQEKKLCCKI